MSHIFISYSKRNKSYARRLADHLIASGFDVWLDDRIDYGSLWMDVIQKAIEDCAACIVIMTPEARDSSWVNTECEYAAQQRKKVFPLLLAGDVFFRYVSVQYADIRDGSLPPDAFLDELAEVAPRKPGAGENVTAPEARAVAGAVAVPEIRTRRRITPLVIGAGILAALLIVAAILLLGDGADGDPETQASTEVAEVVETPTQAAAANPASTAQAGDCQYDWFFGNEFALSEDCPISEAIRYHGFMQRFGEGVLIGIDTGHYYTLYNDGRYMDDVEDWYTDTGRIGGCPVPTINMFSEIMSYDSSADEVIGCPLEPLEEEEISYQGGDTSGHFVVYIGLPEGDVYRLDAPSSRPGTEGTWKQVK